MPEDNVEVVRNAIGAFNREGVEAALAYLDPEIEWLGPPEWLEEHLYKGHDGIRRIASHWRENFDGYRIDLEEHIDAGDHVVALVYLRGDIKGGGGPIEQRAGYDWELRDGKGVRVQVYFSWEEALGAVGLAE